MKRIILQKFKCDGTLKIVLERMFRLIVFCLLVGCWFFVAVVVFCFVDD